MFMFRSTYTDTNHNTIDSCSRCKVFQRDTLTETSPRCSDAFWKMARKRWHKSLLVGVAQNSFDVIVVTVSADVVV